MSYDSTTLDEQQLQNALDALHDAFYQFDSLLRQYDELTWERWRAGGSRVTGSDWLYPTAKNCVP